jgi:hypothetical protein
MSVAIDRFQLTVYTNAGDARARAFAGRLPQWIPAAIGAACSGEAVGDGALLVPRLRVELGVDFAGSTNDDVARAIAGAFVDHLTKVTSSPASAIGAEAAARETVNSIIAGKSLRCPSAEVEAAAWLLARLRNSSTTLWRRSFDREFSHMPIGAALCELVRRASNSRALIEGLGTSALERIARHCTEAEAEKILGLLEDYREPDAATLRAVELSLRQHFSDLAGAPHRCALIACSAAIQQGLAGASKTARERVRDIAQQSPASSTAAGYEQHVFPSNLTGLWCLLPALAYRLRGVGEQRARRMAIEVAALLAGKDAPADPAIAAWEAARPEDVDSGPIDRRSIVRLAVRAIRDFAAGLTRLERARCTYILRAVLSGPGLVLRTPSGWEATLPRSPLRIILDRAGLLGPIATPWNRLDLRFVRDAVQ